MSVEIKQVSGYYFTRVWVMANIVQLATIDFCRTYLNKDNDPCGRMYDQMTQAARSVTANIAEGYSRHQTSRETEMKLLDVARASVSELAGDYFFFSLDYNIQPWDNNSTEYKNVAFMDVEGAKYLDNLISGVWKHILTEKSKFDKWLKAPDISTRLNALMILCSRETALIGKLISKRLDEFGIEGGFTENLSQLRLEKRKEMNAQAPRCPKCGEVMIKRIIQRGARSGREFWGCSKYPACMGTRDV